MLGLGDVEGAVVPVEAHSPPVQGRLDAQWHADGLAQGRGGIERGIRHAQPGHGSAHRAGGQGDVIPQRQIALAADDEGLSPDTRGVHGLEEAFHDVVDVHGMEVLATRAHHEEGALGQHAEHLQHAHVARTIQGTWADDDDLHVGLRHHAAAELLGLELGLLIEVAGIEGGLLVGGRLAYMAMHADGGAMHEAAHTGLAGRFQHHPGAFHVDAPVALRRARGRAEVGHQMDDAVGPFHQLRSGVPVGDVGHHDAIHPVLEDPCLAGVPGQDGQLMAAFGQQAFREMAAQEARGPGDGDPRLAFWCGVLCGLSLFGHCRYAKSFYLFGGKTAG